MSSRDERSPALVPRLNSFKRTAFLAQRPHHFTVNRTAHGPIVVCACGAVMTHSLVIPSRVSPVAVLDVDVDIGAALLLLPDDVAAVVDSRARLQFPVAVLQASIAARHLRACG